MKNTLLYLISTLIFNTAIAGVLTMLMPGIPFRHEFIYSQCIGLSVLSINLWVVAYVQGGIRRWGAFAVSLPGSVALGLTLASTISGVGGWGDEHVWQSMVLGLFFGLIGAVTVLLSERIEAEVKQRQLIKSESERREVEANLKLLQAQIEPHFLFNTLANAVSLIDGDPVLAKRLLERLNDWLRVALVRARSDSATLGDELDMLENYLQILKIRFGERLRWNMDVPEDASRLAFPPMLLQPLVENAVRHGIEPKLGGGEIGIRASIEKAMLRIEVNDSGVGLTGDANADGAGLVNVRARLATLFGDAGNLMLANNAGGGVTAILELPQ
ncbi:MAG: histidine kinase [Nitrosomonadales bacterium]|nr:histidine kinase [Nitrosomonadales bacterium]